MRISDWSSDVCSSDLADQAAVAGRRVVRGIGLRAAGAVAGAGAERRGRGPPRRRPRCLAAGGGSAATSLRPCLDPARLAALRPRLPAGRSEEHTSELQSLMRISYAVFCLKKKKNKTTRNTKARTTLNKSRDNHNSTLIIKYYIST